MSLVNLDALIRREDFEVIEADNPEWNKIDRIQIRDLEPNAFFYDALRKPDFQRETANWSAEKISDFVKTFLNGDLIPAIILWKAGKNIFVIDGAHRLSALLAWVHNDYGDGKASREFFQNLIPEEQQDAADKVRALIQRTIGTYAEHATAVIHQDESKPEVVERAKRLATLSVQLQWVTGNARKAEDAFFKINQEAVPIDKTELRILKARNSPNALSARVVVRSATGHKYWSKFQADKQQEAVQLGKEIYANLFTPSLKTPLKTLDIPVAGRGYSAQALPLIFELVNLANSIEVIDVRRPGRAPTAVPEDLDGVATVNFLKNTRKLLYRISGTHPSSLGLHPAVYFYSAAGRYQPTSFLAIVRLVKEFDEKDWFAEFTEIRSRFEAFLLKYKHFSNQVTVKFGSGSKGFDRLKNLYWFILEQLHNHHDEAQVLSELRDNHTFSFLNPDVSHLGPNRNWRTKFDGETKSEIFLREALESPIRCKICDGLIHINSITIDHITRRQDGGMAIADNGQLTHPYCNSGYKESQHAHELA